MCYSSKVWFGLLSKHSRTTNSAHTHTHICTETLENISHVIKSFYRVEHRWHQREDEEEEGADELVSKRKKWRLN